MKVIIFGTGSFYQKNKEQLKIKGTDIVAFADNDKHKQGTIFEGKPVISPQTLNKYEYDYIIVASSCWITIETQLLGMGIEQHKILIPFFSNVPMVDDNKNEMELKKLKQKWHSCGRKKVSLIIQNGTSHFINRFIEVWKEFYDIYSFNLNIISARKYLKEIMKYSDLCFFEWAGDVLAYGSNLQEAANIPIVSRIHRYEVFSDEINLVNWENVDKIVFIADYIRSLFLSKTKTEKEKTILIYNGFDFSEFQYRDRTHGFRVAYLGALIYRKAPEMLLQIIKKLVEIDDRYKLYMAGKSDDEEIKVYLDYMVKEMGLQNNVIYDGFQTDVNEWLEDKDYILCSSISEGHITAIQEAMVKGIKPAIHNYPGAKELYGSDCLWNTIDEAVELITKSQYKSRLYYDFIYKHFELPEKAKEFKELFDQLINKTVN